MKILYIFIIVFTFSCSNVNKNKNAKIKISTFLKYIEEYYKQKPKKALGKDLYKESLIQNLINDTSITKNGIIDTKKFFKKYYSICTFENNDLKSFLDEKEIYKYKLIKLKAFIKTLYSLFQSYETTLKSIQLTNLNKLKKKNVTKYNKRNKKIINITYEGSNENVWATIQASNSLATLTASLKDINENIEKISKENLDDKETIYKIINSYICTFFCKHSLDMHHRILDPCNTMLFPDYIKKYEVKDFYMKNILEIIKTKNNIEFLNSKICFFLCKNFIDDIFDEDSKFTDLKNLKSCMPLALSIPISDQKQNDNHCLDKNSLKVEWVYSDPLQKFLNNTLLVSDIYTQDEKDGSIKLTDKKEINANDIAKYLSMILGPTCNKLTLKEEIEGPDWLKEKINKVLDFVKQNINEINPDYNNFKDLIIDGCKYVNNNKPKRNSKFVKNLKETYLNPLISICNSLNQCPLKKRILEEYETISKNNRINENMSNLNLAMKVNSESKLPIYEDSYWANRDLNPITISNTDSILTPTKPNMISNNEQQNDQQQNNQKQKPKQQKSKQQNNQQPNNQQQKPKQQKLKEQKNQQRDSQKQKPKQQKLKEQKNQRWNSQKQKPKQQKSKQQKNKKNNKKLTKELELDFNIQFLSESLKRELYKLFGVNSRPKSLKELFNINFKAQKLLNFISKLKNEEINNPELEGEIEAAIFYLLFLIKHNQNHCFGKNKKVKNPEYILKVFKDLKLIPFRKNKYQKMLTLVC